MRGTSLSGTSVEVGAVAAAGRAIVTLMPQPASVPLATAIIGSATRRAKRRRCRPAAETWNEGVVAGTGKERCTRRDYRAPGVAVTAGVLTGVDAAGAVAVSVA